MSLKSPNWKEEELILVLNLYLEHDIKWLNSASEKTQEIIDISDKLKKLNLYNEIYKEIPNFRSPSSVHMKLMNFKGLDPKYGKYGLRNVSNLDREVWFKYSGDPERLKKEVNDILRCYYKDHSKIAAISEEHTINSKISSSISLLTEFANLCTEIRKDAINISDIGISQKIVESMYNILLSLTQNKTALQNLEKLLISDKTETTQEAIDSQSDESKIGKYVRESFSEIIASQKLTDDDIKNLMDGNWSKDTFRIGYPFLKKIQNDIPIKMQIKCGKYQRYWEKEFIIAGNSYLVCKEWYKTNRNNYVKWLNGIEIENNAKGLGQAGTNADCVYIPAGKRPLSIKKELLAEILKTIKKFDKEDICIEFEKVNNFLKEKILQKSNYKNPEKVVDAILKHLINIGVVVHFQKNGNDGKYMIEDYEHMSELIKDPQI